MLRTEFERMEQTDQVWRLQAYGIKPNTKVALAPNWSTLPVLITVSTRAKLVHITCTNDSFPSIPLLKASLFPLEGMVVHSWILYSTNDIKRNNGPPTNMAT